MRAPPEFDDPFDFLGALVGSVGSIGSAPAKNTSYGQQHPVAQLETLLKCPRLERLDLRGCFFQEAEEESSKEKRNDAPSVEKPTDSPNALPLLRARRLALSARTVTVYCVLRNNGNAKWKKKNPPIRLDLPAFTKWEDIPKALARVEPQARGVSCVQQLGTRHQQRICEQLNYAQQFQSAKTEASALITVAEEWRKANPNSALFEFTDGLMIRVKDQTGEETYFHVKWRTRMSKVFDTYAMRKGVEVHALRFLIDGERISPMQTPKELELEDQDQIDCMLEQMGD